MEDFRVILPSPALAPWVKHYWLLRTVGGASARTVPTGMTSIVAHRGGRLLSGRENVLQPRVFLSGQERTFADLRGERSVNMIAAVFRPAGARAFFPLPIDRLAGLLVTPGDLEDRGFAALETSLTATEDDRTCIRLIERFLLGRLHAPADHNLKRVEEAIRLIDAGQSRVEALADAACLSRKQFERVFSELVGARPKEFARTIRFQRALHTLQSAPGLPFARLAADGGYYDQPHLIREFRALSGYTPGEYLAAGEPFSDYF